MYSQQDIITRTKKNFAFSIYIDDYGGLTKSFDTIFEFFYNQYFLGVAFGPVYLTKKKTRIFDNNLQIICYKRWMNELLR